MRRLLLAAAIGAATGLLTAGPALGAADLATKVIVEQGPVAVDGSQVDVPVRIVDVNGDPVGRVLVRLMVPATFMGAEKNEIVAEATTNDSGRAVLQFAPSQTGQVEATVVFWGAHSYAPSEAPVAFDVTKADYSYTPEPVGLQAWWARSYLILIPFLAVWFTYLLVVRLIVGVRRAGSQAASPEHASS